MTGLVLGIDPGTAATGYGLVTPKGKGIGELLECGVIKTNSTHHLARRLQSLYEGVSEVIERQKPTVLAIESVFLGRNAQSTIALAQGRGIAMLAASQAGLEIHEYAPATVKKVVAGTGRARKEQIAYMVQTLLRLKTPPQPSDAADGVALALTFILTARTFR
jgi:crossover junction endodeoxyribonuclease RuvC